MKKVIVISLVVFGIVGLVSLDSVGYPAMDSCTAAMIGHSQALYWHNICLMYGDGGSGSCGYTSQLVADAWDAVERNCNIEG